MDQNIFICPLATEEDAKDLLARFHRAYGFSQCLGAIEKFGPANLDLPTSGPPATNLLAYLDPGGLNPLADLFPLREFGPPDPLDHGNLRKRLRSVNLLIKAFAAAFGTVC